MSMLSDNGTDDGIMNDINMTPLIDVMLVLLIIFIVTLPVMTHALKVDLPQAAATHDTTHDESVDVSIDAAGTISWNKVPIDDAELGRRIAQAAAEPSQPIVRIYADRHVAYERVVHVLSAAQTSGLSKLDFVTDPPNTGAGG